MLKNTHIQKYNQEHKKQLNNFTIKVWQSSHTFFIENIIVIRYNLYRIDGEYMNDIINVNLKNLEEQIDSSTLSDYDKKILFEMLQGILSSERGRLYVKNHAYYKEYVALRDQPGDNEADLSFCIIRRVVDEATGGTATRSYEFPNYSELLRYYHENRAALSIEITKASLNKGKSIATELGPESIIDKAIEQINKQTNISSHKRQRAIDVLQSVKRASNGNFFMVQQPDYEEYITIRNSNIVLARRMIDYAGSTAGRTFQLLNIVGLIEYLEENKTKLGEEEEKGFQM